MREPWNHVVLAAAVALGFHAQAAAAEGWSMSLAYGSAQEASSSNAFRYSRPVQLDRQEVDVDASALLAAVEWQFSPHLGLALEYHHGGDATIAQTIEATAFHPQGDGPRTSHVLTAGPLERDLPIDQRFASLGLVVHFIQLGRVEITPRLLLSRALGLPGDSEIRLTSVGVPAAAILDDIPFGETLETFVRSYRIDTEEELGWAMGLDAEITLGWKRWHDPNALSLLLSARFYRFDPLRASAASERIEVAGQDPILLPQSRFRMDMEPTFLGAGLRYRF